MKPQSVRKAGTRIADLPRVQDEVQRIFGEQGVTLELAGAVLAEVMDHGLDETVLAADKLKAVELYLRATSGFAVQKAAHLHERVKRDKFFDEDVFTAPAAPLLAIDSEEAPVILARTVDEPPKMRPTLRRLRSKK